VIRDKNGGRRRVQGVSESAVSAKRGWGQFGAKPTQSETPARAAPSGVRPEEGKVEKKMA